MCDLAQLHNPDGTNEVSVLGMENLVADNRTFSGRYPMGGSLDFFRNLMCGTVTPSFHHVLVHFPSGHSDYDFNSGMSLFGKIGLNGASGGVNAHVAEVKVLSALSGAWNECVHVCALYTYALCMCIFVCVMRTCSACSWVNVLIAVLDALLSAAVDRQTEVDAMMRKYGIGGNGRSLAPHTSSSAV